MDNVVIVCGSRNGTSSRARQLVFDTLNKMHAEKPITMIKHGTAKGYDTWAGEWAFENKIKCNSYHANWNDEGSGAGDRRNERMAKSGANQCIAFPGGEGTASMKRWCGIVGIPVIDIAFPEVTNVDA